MSEQKERLLYRPLIEGAAMEGWSLFRLEDGSWGKKPFDIAGIAPSGLAVGLEVKAPYHCASDTIPWRLFSAHQRLWLEEYATQGGIALATIGCEDKVIVYKLSKELPEAFAVYELVKNKFGTFSGWTQLL
jgi:hypothetical protein